MDLHHLELDLIRHLKPLRDWILCKVSDRDCLIEDSDVCLILATGDPSYKNWNGYKVDLNVKKGDQVVVPRKISRITADITTDYFICSMFDILSVWK